jgi:hypothetical protein
MSSPIDIRQRAEREVSEAYRALPSPEPSAELDARIRAAVEAELAEKAHCARLFGFPRWRQARFSLALAASMLIAVGLGVWVNFGNGIGPGEMLGLKSQAPHIAAAPPGEQDAIAMAPAPEASSPGAPLPAEEAPTLAQVRELLARGDRERARQILENWHSIHSGEKIPDEFASLLKAPDSDASKVAP